MNRGKMADALTSMAESYETLAKAYREAVKNETLIPDGKIISLSLGKQNLAYDDYFKAKEEGQCPVTQE